MTTAPCAAVSTTTAATTPISVVPASTAFSVLAFFAARMGAEDTVAVLPLARAASASALPPLSAIVSSNFVNLRGGGASEERLGGASDGTMTTPLRVTSFGVFFTKPLRATRPTFTAEFARSSA